MRPKKTLGQNFLKCGWVVSTMLNAAEIKHEDIVLEIGPGTGILTRALAERAGHVIAIEKDEVLAAGLSSALKKEGADHVFVVNGDILDLYQNKFKGIPLESRRHKVVANIPYYLTSRLLRVMLEAGPRPESAVLTIQKEVAERICAKPPKMNLLALAVQVFGDPKIIKKVPADCFSPKPSVDSAIIKIERISDDFFRQNGFAEKEFFGVVRLAFSQQRKQLVNSLAKLGEKRMILDALRRAELAEKARPAELNLTQWAQLVKAL